MFVKNIKKALGWVLPYELVLNYQRWRRYLAATPDPHWKPLTPLHEECIIIANGPSTKELLSKVKAYSEKADIITVNLSLQDASIRELKPVAHFCVDLLVFDKTSHYYSTLLNTLRYVSWPMRLYVPEKLVDLDDLRKDIPQNIEIKTVSVEIAPSFFTEQQRFTLMDKGCYGCGHWNVVVSALFVAINSGYKKLWACGMDANYIANLKPDEYCRSYQYGDHFYENGKQKSVTQLSMFDLYYKLENFTRQMEIARLYAEHRNCICINLSLTSFHDVFPKGTLDGVVYENKRAKPAIKIW